MPEISVFQAQEYRDQHLSFPVLAEGYQQWFGDGYYFWEDIGFAHWWGEEKKISQKNRINRYCIYEAKLEFSPDEVIDTVFNEEDYSQFIKVVEKFAGKFNEAYGKRPSLFEFNEFISDNNIWTDICVIRFQDLPGTNRVLSVSGFPYKKRIQLRVNDPNRISSFTHVFNSDK
ncbi:hypothetical protein [Dyadobacter sp. MSC1_007]|jgi:hypothetical protein|uniref:hypothetical protein n=1 Tax=Dyadobacter sp. MSC1_007 TaxID=2909264 RepID=UPI00202F0982|nr:hypothetical protein [Dyadobacter sp. MSC1_007]